MKYLILIALITACKKESLPTTHLATVEKYLGKKMIEIKVGNQYGYIDRPPAPWENPVPDDIDYGDWGTWTGYLMNVECCFIHGTFTWSGDPNNYVFQPDPQYTGDNIIGFGNFCWDDCESFGRMKN